MVKLRDMSEKLRNKFTKVDLDQLKEGMEFKLVLMRALLNYLEERNKFLAKRFFISKWYMKVEKSRQKDEAFENTMILTNIVISFADIFLSQRFANVIPVARTVDFFSNLKKIRGDRGKEKIITPKKFISNFQKVKKHIAAKSQQDAREFISILLDQLHEDLNRISNKPYIELLEKQPNEDDMIASKRWWDLHKKREDSIIIDLFNGQLKSETICQVMIVSL